MPSQKSMRTLAFSIAAAFLTSACTPAMQEHLSRETDFVKHWPQLATRDYAYLPQFDQIRPWIKDYDAFDKFMTKYKEKRVLPERERMEILIQLGVPEYAPQWLTPSTKKKINQILKEQPSLQASTDTQRPILLASLDVVSDVPQGTFTLALLPAFAIAPFLATPPGMVLTAGTALYVYMQYRKAVANIELIRPTIKQVEQDLTDQALNELEDEQDAACQASTNCVKSKNNSNDDILKAPLPLPDNSQLGAYDPTSESLKGTNGDCDPQKYNKLRQAQEQACGGPRQNVPSCDPANDNKAVMQKKAANLANCIITRANLARQCFRNGDMGHRMSTSQLFTAYNNCLSSIRPK